MSADSTPTSGHRTFLTAPVETTLWWYVWSWICAIYVAIQGVIDLVQSLA